MTKSRILSFKYAFEGLFTAFKDEPNLKIHFLIGLIVLVMGAYLQISQLDWVILIITIGLVIGLELTNTAIEEMVNVFMPAEHPSAKKAKDVAAAAVLIGAIVSLVIGAIVFLPYLHVLNIK